MMASVEIKDKIESAAKDGAFGENCVFVDIVPQNFKGEDHFASDVIFSEVKLQNGDILENVNVVIKIQQKDALIREVMNTAVQFYNEVLMYKEILPFLNKNNIIETIFPKLIHGCATLGDSFESDILVLEDLRQYNYKLTKERLFLDFEHCSLALKKLGQFHALSYCMKQEKPDKFFTLVEQLKEVRKGAESQEESDRFLLNSIERGILPLIQADEYVYLLEQFIDKARNPGKFMQKICQPEEPVAVVCHGDFCRNNMVFKYDDTGKPIDVRFFDIATARYSSPAIDLSFFLFMNTSAELRSARLDDLFKVYHDALKLAIPGYKVPSLDTIRQDFSRKAAYGYVLCSFFIPMMMDFDKEKEMADFATKTPEEMEAVSQSRGGEQATKFITDVVRDLVKLNSL